MVFHGEWRYRKGNIVEHYAYFRRSRLVYVIHCKTCWIFIINITNIPSKEFTFMPVQLNVQLYLIIDKATQEKSPNGHNVLILDISFTNVLCNFVHNLICINYLLIGFGASGIQLNFCLVLILTCRVLFSDRWLLLRFVDELYFQLNLFLFGQFAKTFHRIFEVIPKRIIHY